MSPDSFQSWLCKEIGNRLGRKSDEPGFILWCDADLEWKDLLVEAAACGGFELWADETHELLLRERFYQTYLAKRIIWLPIARDEIGYFKVFELRAMEVITWSLAEALAGYGVELPPDQLSELKPLLAAHAKEWFGHPYSTWKELTPGNAKGTLMDDDMVLEMLATPGKQFDTLVAENRFSLLARRLTEDFGLPVPVDEKDADGWRTNAVAALLCTDAAQKCPSHPPSDAKRVIPPGTQRERALKLLNRWQKQVDFAETFEVLATKADSQAGLGYWVRGLTLQPPPLASPAAEKALFDREVEAISGIQDFESLAKALDAKAGFYRNHAEGFWGKYARESIRWGHLGKLAAAAGVLLEQAGAESQWKSLGDAVTWFTCRGWEADQQGEMLFRDDSKMPGALAGVLARTRKAYLRHVDTTNAAFSEMLSHTGPDSLDLPFAGDVIQSMAAGATAKEPVAVFVLDACRFDLGMRLAELLNQGEPARRAEVSAARAPVPSITALGMPLCLPGAADTLQVDISDKKWRVTAKGFPGDLTQAQQRRTWLKSNFKLKDNAVSLAVDDIVDATSLDSLNAKSLGRLVFVFGDELDDHDCVLKPFGLDQTLERYATAIRKLRAAGYYQVAMVTDHGFYHWEPDADEKELAKPEGDILIESRRAVAGHDLTHRTALTFHATKSEVDVCIPRSVNCFKTYGRIGFFHGGATLQELVTPVLIARWPRKARKISVVLKPLDRITSLTPRVEIAPAAGQRDLLGAVDENLLSRNVILKVVDPASGKALFRAKQVVVLEPGGVTRVVELERFEGAEATLGAELQLLALDAEDEEILDRQQVTLHAELDNWF